MLLKADHLFFIALFINANVGVYLEVGEECNQRNDRSQGTCLLVTDCVEAMRYIRNRERHPFARCGFDNDIEIVCCPKSADAKRPTATTSKPVNERAGTNGLRIVEKQCKKIVEGSLPPLDLHIIGGEDAQLGEFPHMAALGYLINGEYDFSCGGTLIWDNFVMTADHCVDNVQQIKPSIVRLGVVNIGESKFNPETDIRISEIISYPGRTSLYKYHDIALLKLEKSAEYSISLVPACLFTGDTVPAVPLTVTGWGRTSITKDVRGEILQKANVTLVASSECDRHYENWRKLPEGIKLGQFCAGDPQGRTDACQGDSGGPIQALTSPDGHYRILGVTSFGRGCGSTVPGVYTRIYPYLDWIESVVWPNGA